MHEAAARARSRAPAWLNLALPLIAIGATLILCSGLIALAGVGVFEAYGSCSVDARRQLCRHRDAGEATPMIFTGLAVAVAFRAKFWNIGAEGQLMAGAVAAALVGAIPMPGPLAMLLMAARGRCRRGGWSALVPALLRVQLKVDDVVSSLLLNSIIFYALMALIEGPWKDPFSGYPISPPIEDSADLPDADRGHAAASRRARGASSRRRWSGS